MNWTSYWTDFHFIRPLWLAALIPLALLLFWLRHQLKRQSGWQPLLASHLYQFLVTSEGKQDKPPIGLLALGWLLVVIALAGPTWERLPQPVYQLNTGKVVLMDMSLSMRATDLKPNRLARARFKAMDLVRRIGEGDTGLVAYAGDAFVISPLTQDVQNLENLIPSLSPDIMPTPGSEPIWGLETASELLAGAGFQQGEIYWITDGIDARQLPELRTFIGKSPYRISILAVGSEDGAPVKLADGELLKDSRGAIVVPKLNTALLEPLASEGRGRLTQLQPDDSDIDYLADQPLLDRKGEESDDLSPTGDQWQEQGPYLLLLLLPLAAYGFRRGVLSICLALMLVPMAPQKAHANWWDNLWQTPDQQGMKAYQQQNFAAAGEKFDDPLWQGSAHYRNGDYESALSSFSLLDTPESNYNRGNTLAKLGQLQEAIEAYQQTLQVAPNHKDAIDNKALLEELLKQQEQEQQQNQQSQQDGQDQQNKQQQDGDGQQEQNDQDGQQDQQDSDGQQQNDSEPSPQSEDQQQQSPEKQGEDEEQQQSDSQQPQQEKERDGEEQEANVQPAELTDEQKEQMQRMEQLLRKVPDDPAYLLKRKMQLEYQKRRRQRVPGARENNW